MKINKFPENLKMIRKQSQLSQEELGKKINVSKQTISKYEKGIAEPNFHTLVEISKVFNCSLDSLVFGNVKLKNKNPALLNLEIEKKMNLFTKEISDAINNYFEYDNNLDSTEEYSEELSQFDTILLNLEIEKKMNLFTKEISDAINNYFEYDNNLDSTEEYSEELSQFDTINSCYYKNKNLNSIDIDFYNKNNIIIFNAPKYKHLADNKFNDIPIIADISAGYPIYTTNDRVLLLCILRQFRL